MIAPRPVLLALVWLAMSGCWFRKNTSPKIPASVPAAQPAAAQPVASQPAAEQPGTTQPPTAQPPAVELPTVQPPAAQPVTPQAPPATPAAPPKPAVRRNPVPVAPPPVTPAPPPATPVAPIAPPPPLREIISIEQRRQYEAEFSQSVVRAGAVLKQASTRTLDAGQQETSARIRTFISQANALRDEDISTALQLARRADLLGQELLKSLK